jgi:hypothetical protein
MQLNRFYQTLYFVLVMFYSCQAHAVRPFVTDDARIIDYGQLELESWLETTRANGRYSPAPGLNFIGGITVNDWLQFLAGSGVGLDSSGDSTVSNPVVMGKVLLKAAELNGAPGYAVSAGATLNSGRGEGLYDDGRVTSLVGMSTYRLLDDALNIHLNVGARTDSPRGEKSKTRLFWGVGFDTEALHEDMRVIGEVFAGDPLELNAPKIAMQSGVRWMFSDYTQLDVTFGLQPELDARNKRNGEYEKTLQIGFRFLFDTFTRGGNAGNPNGAKGLF